MSDPIAEHELLTEHAPTPATHHLACGAPWMTSHTVDGDYTETVKICPACGTPN